MRLISFFSILLLNSVKKKNFARISSSLERLVASIFSANWGYVWLTREEVETIRRECVYGVAESKAILITPTFP